MDASRPDRSLGELFAELAQQVSVLVRQEMQLAKTEMSDKLSGLGRDVAWLGVGALIAHASLLGLMAALILGVVQIGLDPWLAALVTASATGGVAAVLMRSRLKAIARREVSPEATIDSLKETVKWVKNEVS